MRICADARWGVLMAGLLYGLAAVAQPIAQPMATPYGVVSLPFELYKVPDAPIYYVIGLSGVPGADNEGHTSNAGFVVTGDGVVVFDALGTPALGYRLLQRIREVTAQPVRRVIVSHYHADHIYGLQAFKEHAAHARAWAQRGALDYVGGAAASNQGENARRRLEQRREALFPWVDENTYVVAPDLTFEKSLLFRLGGLTFEVRHMGPAHAPGDAALLVQEHGVLFSGDVIYGGRIPFLDSPETDIDQWLAGLDYIAGLGDEVRYIIPGHGGASQNPQQAVAATRDYITYVRHAMAAAVQDFVPFDEAYANTDWSAWEDLPAFDASNRGNAYRIYLEEEERSLGE
ncbi:MAG: MBL fold metallo-hydrolase [Gammaproteobacteria bacterium]|nr:MBL fold metallo-hydrolase [Gammaproteobacteria bacterium]